MEEKLFFIPNYLQTPTNSTHVFRYPPSIMLKDLRAPLSYIIPKW